MKTSELTEAALDWAVAKCEGFTEYDPATEKMLPPRKEYGWVELYDLNYSTDWAQGGPIIEREGMYLCKTHRPYSERNETWMATDSTVQITEFGTTPLIAAMRCYVASKLGDEIEIPKELT